MTMTAWAVEMSRYSRWQNKTLYDLCDDLTDAQRTEDGGMFFKSIHHTLQRARSMSYAIVVMVLVAGWMGSIKPF